MNNTSGFWRIDAQNPEALQFAPNFVYCPSGTLRRGENLGPLEGWTWFDSVEEAEAFYELPTSAGDAALAEHGMTR